MLTISPPVAAAAKRFFEPRFVRRSWATWWYDTSKQGIGAMVIHMINVYAAPLFQGDPCTWYIINFLLDSTIGLFIIFVGIRLAQMLAIRRQCPAIMFGEYSESEFINTYSWIRKRNDLYELFDTQPHRDRGCTRRASTSA